LYTFHITAPSSMAMSMYWPRPVCSRAITADRMPTAAIREPAPMSAICTPGMTGGPLGVPMKFKTPA
jgi:hypothetical protein